MNATTTRRRPPAKKKIAPSRLPLLLGGLAVLALAVVIAVLTTSDTASAVHVADLAGSPEVRSDPLPPFGGDPASDPATGQRAPQVDGQGLAGTANGGRDVTIGEAGTPQLLVFLASWCPACQAELPELVEWLDAGNLPDDVELTAVVTGLDDTRPNWPPTDWLEREGYTGATIVDDADGTIAQTYGMSGTPFWVAVDADGQVVARAAGQLPMPQVQRLADAIS
ncbi:TlpA family protein disulfide reductase [Egicoccus sp. AB-alg2]|uniref:TlpA family protein disulfide reductase n=1 Tax=Egicoccus sp. AB-alg2 TaxID=3242693 RepID=UPI00359E1F6D